MVTGKGPENGCRNPSEPSKRAAGEAQHNRDADPNGERPVKRSRVSRACDQCRSSREKCDDFRPKCHACSSQNRTCSYNEQPKKRGFQPNYIRTLELTLAWLFQTLPETQTTLSSNLSRDDTHARRLISGKDPAASEVLHLVWRESIVNRQVDQILSGAPVEKVDLDSPKGIQPEEEGAYTAHTTYNSPPLSAPSEQTGFAQPEIEAEPPIESNISLDALTTAVDGSQLLKLPENAWTLLDHYFAFTHSWLPITEKHNILKLMYSYPSDGVQHHEVRVAEHAELWSIINLAATQISGAMDRNELQRIRETTESLIPAGNAATYEVPHIKAMLLLALSDTHEEHITVAWLRIGCVVRLLLLSKLLENVGGTQKWCRHIHLAAFVLESALSLRLKAPAHLSPAYIEAIGYVDEDGLDEWAPWHDPLATSLGDRHTKTPARAFSTLNRLIKLCLDSHHDGPASRNVNAAEDFIVFSLLANASLKQNSVQPSVLVARYDKTGIDTHVEKPSSSRLRSSPAVGTLATNAPGTTGDQMVHQPPSMEARHQVHQHHPFMSIPNEVNVASFETSPAISNGSRLAQTTWETSPTDLLNTQSRGGSDEVSNAALDIFEELATLEMPDSTQPPHFMQNLGFANPDLALLEFFGADYQPSDPLLAYMQPTQFSDLGANDGAGAYNAAQEP